MSRQWKKLCKKRAGIGVHCLPKTFFQWKNIALRNCITIVADHKHIFKTFSNLLLLITCLKHFSECCTYIHDKNKLFLTLTKVPNNLIAKFNTLEKKAPCIPSKSDVNMQFSLRHFGRRDSSCWLPHCSIRAIDHGLVNQSFPCDKHFALTHNGSQWKGMIMDSHIKQVALSLTVLLIWIIFATFTHHTKDNNIIYVHHLKHCSSQFTSFFSADHYHDMWGF